MANQNDNIISQLSSQVGLFERVFGALLPSVVWDQRREGAKNILKNVYGFKDIEYLFPKAIERKNFAQYLKILFQQYNAEVEKDNEK